MDDERLRAACLLHHSDESALSARATVQLLHDVFRGVPQIVGASEPIPETVLPILEAWRRLGAGDGKERMLADILRLCDAFDQEFEAQPFERQNAAQIIGVLRGGVADGLWSQAAMQGFEECTRPQATFLAGRLEDTGISQSCRDDARRHAESVGELEACSRRGAARPGHRRWRHETCQLRIVWSVRECDDFAPGDYAIGGLQRLVE
ncbi:MAG: hypothetical protein WDO73_17165 [Ignavibacteriota bacterium]